MLKYGIVLCNLLTRYVKTWSNIKIKDWCFTILLSVGGAILHIYKYTVPGNGIQNIFVVAPYAYIHP